MNSPGDRPPPSPASLRASLAGIDAELAALRARVEELTAARKPIVDALKAIVYPILTIPVEITAEIFLRCVDWALISDQQPRYLSEPLVLAGVCQQWRAVALNLEPIWSRFRISCGHIPKVETLLAWWLPRAGGRLLEVDLMDGRVIAALIPHSSRWKSLSCTFRLGYPTGLTTMQGHMPHLGELHIAFARRQVLMHVLSLFSEAPLLRAVHIAGTAFNLITLPWGQLTTLDLRLDATAMHAEILQRTPQLQVLHLERAGRQSVFPKPVLTLHHLHTLELHCDLVGRNRADALLDALILPALRHFNIAMFPEELVRELQELLTRSSCSLASMSFRSSSMPLCRQLVLHKAILTSAEIYITDMDWVPFELRDFFTKMHRSAGILPNLRTLSMSSAWPVDLPYAAMAKMVASRQESKEGYARLESFQLTLPQLTPVDETASVMFENATAQGCKIDIQGLKGFDIGSVHTDLSAGHSYTL
ncbi:hypothetical protein C8R46DRAFT_1194808 [Mycena filopes]|nr:hypothetical protein C8R46DRAFT_1194808 [Mycena filopes]